MPKDENGRFLFASSLTGMTYGQLSGAWPIRRVAKRRPFALETIRKSCYKLGLQQSAFPAAALSSRNFWAAETMQTSNRPARNRSKRCQILAKDVLA